MPWHVAKSDECSASKPWAVIKDSDGSVVACHETEESAKDQLAALYANEEGRAMSFGDPTFQVSPGFDLERFMERIKDAVTSALGIGQRKEPPERAIGVNHVWEQVNMILHQRDDWVWLMDIYLDEGQTYALLTRDGKLYKAGIEIDGGTVTLAEDWEQVVEVHQPVGRTVIRQQADGRYRWFSVSCSAVLNRVGEIDSRDLFDAFVAQVEEIGEYPERDFYHGGTQYRTGQCDFLARDGNLLITSGLYDDTELGRLEVKARLADPDYYGDSIAYDPIGAPDRIEVAEGITVPVYRDGAIRFISTLPEEGAAALFTTGTVTEEVTRMLKGKAFEEFVKLFEGDEEAATAWMETNVDDVNRSIEDEGLVTREAETDAEDAEAPEAEETDSDEGQERDSDEPEAPEQPEGDEDAEEVQEFVLDDEAVAAIADQVTGSPLLASMAQRIDELAAAMTDMAERMTKADREGSARATQVNERLDNLERDEDDRQREWQQDLPRRQTVRVTHRPRQANDPASEGQESMADMAASTLAEVPSLH